MRSCRSPAALALTLAFAAGCGCGASLVPYAGAPPVTAVDPDLPADVRLKTATESFTHEWYVALRGGRIWIRPNVETGGA